MMSLRAYSQYIEMVALGNAAHPEKSNELSILFDKMLASRPKQLKHVFMTALARGDLEGDPTFEQEVKELIRHLPKIDKKVPEMSKKKKAEQDPLNNVVSRPAVSPGSSADTGEGE